jgi:hypothetical protein
MDKTSPDCPIGNRQDKAARLSGRKCNELEDIATTPPDVRFWELTN